MSSIINVGVIVDTVGLLRDYPGGSISIGGAINNYFSLSAQLGVLIDQHTISCQANDVIRMRAIPNADPQNDVIIDVFSDKMEDGNGSSALNHISAVSFTTTTEQISRKYDLGPAHFSGNNPLWGGQNVYEQGLLAASNDDNFLQLTASNPTPSNDPVQFTLGFQIYNGSQWLKYRYDPYIRVNAS